MLTLFKGTCEAVQAMHNYHALVPINTPASNAPGTRAHHSAQSSTSTIRPETFRPQPSKLKDGYTNPSNIADDDEEEPEDDHSFPEPEGDADGGFSYGGSVPLVPPKNKKGGGKGKSKPAVVFDGDEELEQLNARQPMLDGGNTAHDDGSPNGEVPAGMKRMHVPYAHRDIKPGNVMFSDEGNPILMDFGSTVVARMYIATRSEALTQQVSALLLL